MSIQYTRQKENKNTRLEFEIFPFSFSNFNKISLILLSITIYFTSFNYLGNGGFSPCQKIGNVLLGVRIIVTKDSDLPYPKRNFLSSFSSFFSICFIVLIFLDNSELK